MVELKDFIRSECWLLGKWGRGEGGAHTDTGRRGGVSLVSMTQGPRLLQELRKGQEQDRVGVPARTSRKKKPSGIQLK